MANGNTNWKMISFFVGLALALAGVIYAAARVESKVESHAVQADKDLKANAEIHKELKAVDKELAEKCNEQQNDMTEIKTEIKYIRKDMSEILTYIRGLPK